MTENEKNLIKNVLAELVEWEQNYFRIDRNLTDAIGYATGTNGMPFDYGYANQIAEECQSEWTHLVSGAATPIRVAVNLGMLSQDAFGEFQQGVELYEASLFYQWRKFELTAKEMRESYHSFPKKERKRLFMEYMKKRYESIK